MFYFSREYIIYLLENADEVHNDFYLAPDHYNRLALYDVEEAIEKLGNYEGEVFDKNLIGINEKLFVQLWQEEKTVKEIADRLNINERKVYREKKRIASELAYYLNGGDINEKS